MTTQLIKYEAACRALAECKAVDEVKALADKAAAMQAYARMAKDKTLEVDAAEIRIRAERRLGEMLALQKAEGGMATGVRMAGKDADGSAVVRNDRRKDAPKLADAGISKDLSSRAQKLAAVPADEFEAALTEKREIQAREGERVTARLLAEGERRMNSAPPPETAPETEEEDGEDLHQMLADMQRECESYARRIADWQRVMGADGREALVTAIKRYEHAEREKALTDERAAQYQRQRDKALQTIKAIGRVVGESDPDKVLAAVRKAVQVSA